MKKEESENLLQFLANFVQRVSSSSASNVVGGQADETKRLRNFNAGYNGRRERWPCMTSESFSTRGPSTTPSAHVDIS